MTPYQFTQKSTESTQELQSGPAEGTSLNLKVMKKFIHKHVILRYKKQEKQTKLLTNPHYSNTITKYIILDLDC